MKIYPSHNEIDEFTIHLTSQELRNILKGLKTCHGPYGSPWSRNSSQQINQALQDNQSYRSKSW